MDASPCGHCLIINNVEFEPQSELSNRKGSNIDCDKLERRFKKLNFIVDVKSNLKQKVRLVSYFVKTTCNALSALVVTFVKQLSLRFSKSNMHCQLCLRRTIHNMTAVLSSCCPMGLR